MIITSKYLLSFGNGFVGDLKNIISLLESQSLCVIKIIIISQGKPDDLLIFKIVRMGLNRK